MRIRRCLDQEITRKNHQEPKFAVCISLDDPDLLTPRRIYQMLPDESAAKSNYIRVIDNEGEDYLYPADYFLFIEYRARLSKPYLRLLSSVRTSGNKPCD